MECFVHCSWAGCLLPKLAFAERKTQGSVLLLIGAATTSGPNLWPGKDLPPPPPIWRLVRGSSNSNQSNRGRQTSTYKLCKHLQMVHGIILQHGSSIARRVVRSVGASSCSSMLERKLRPPPCGAAPAELDQCPPRSRLLVSRLHCSRI